MFIKLKTLFHIIIPCGVQEFYGSLRNTQTHLMMHQFSMMHHYYGYKVTQWWE